MARTITFQPGERMGSFIEGLVNSGDYNNQSEVIRAAVRLLEEQTAESALSKLRNLIEEGDSSPDVENWSMRSLQDRLDSRDD
ncbi:type II toxin-antitoxin system ParD family antitoxin [Bacterioplanoides sp.]|uniref:type II toxin-antitoxin system ParD family antitoxin n=1 Tax=Bacterioplanoides sp. TaxID=2066072 RepID=UPI003B002F24